jgi:hypothetical protein
MSTNVGFATLSLTPAAATSSRTFGQPIAPQFSRTGPADGDLFCKSVTQALAPLAGAMLLGQNAWANWRCALKGTADPEPSIGASETVFHGTDPQMLDWAYSAATAVGLTTNEYAKLRTPNRDPAQKRRHAMDELAPKTSDLIGLGTDQSLVFEGLTADAVVAATWRPRRGGV